MKTISFINQKGGAGKTTLCVNIAKAITHFHDLPHCSLSEDILLIDADTQRTLTEWQEAGQGLGFDLVAADSKSTLLSAKSLAQATDKQYLLIDTPGKLATLSASVMSISDLIIIPMRPSPCDFWSTVDTLSLIESAMQANPNLKAMIALNQSIVGSTIKDKMVSIITEHCPSIKVADTVVHGRIAFSRSALTGETIFSTPDTVAKKEIKCLTNEILLYLNN